MDVDAPPVLYCKGHLPLLNQKSIAIVGARNVSNFEINIAKSIAQTFVKNGINVVSGYAEGVDKSAHIGALEANGTTTMVLCFGIMNTLDKNELKNFNLEKNALFISQFPPYQGCSKRNKIAGPQRNNVICAMSEAVVVIKSGPEIDVSGKKSGTFDAAKYALEKNIPLYVLSPKKFDSPPKGNIDLIQAGGIEFSDPMEILNELKK